MDKVKLINDYEGIVRPIKAQYKNLSYANLVRQDSFGATGVMCEKIQVKQATATGYAEVGIGGVLSVAFPDSETRRGRVIEDGNVSPTLDTGCEVATVTEDIRIRKLTPKECFRLQGWTDDYYEKAEQVNKDTQLYKQAGNGVTVNVIQAIAERLVDE